MKMDRNTRQLLINLSGFLAALTAVIVSMSHGQTLAQKITAAQVTLDSLKAVQVDSGAIRAKNEVWAVVDADSLLKDFGVKVYKDTVDAKQSAVDTMYVHVDFPLASSSGMKKAFIVGIIQEMQDNVGATPTATTGRLRVRRDRAIATLRNLAQILKNQ
jgi:hypothetical protein